MTLWAQWKLLLSHHRRAQTSPSTPTCLRRSRARRRHIATKKHHPVSRAVEHHVVVDSCVGSIDVQLVPLPFHEPPRSTSRHSSWIASPESKKTFAPQLELHGVMGATIPTPLVEHLPLTVPSPRVGENNSSAAVQIHSAKKDDSGTGAIVDKLMGIACPGAFRRNVGPFAIIPHPGVFERLRPVITSLQYHAASGWIVNHGVVVTGLGTGLAGQRPFRSILLPSVATRFA